MLTVLLATRNGAETLPAVLDAYVKLDSPLGGWRLLIVDNASTDSSREIAASFKTRLPLTCVSEPRVGKNRALNTGLEFAAGDLVVFADDDALPRSDWLVRLRDAADRNPAFDIFAGVVAPRWESEPPNWLLESIPLGAAYTVSDSRLKEGPVDGHHVYGPNMAVRAAIFEAGHRFDVSIGPAPNSYAMGSETEFVLRMCRQGMRAWYVPDAVVSHLVRRRQMQLRWLVGRAIRFGRGQCRLHSRKLAEGEANWQIRRLSNPSQGALTLQARLAYQLARKTGGMALSLLHRKPAPTCRSLWALGYVWGYGREAQAVLWHELFGDDSHRVIEDAKCP